MVSGEDVSNVVVSTLDVDKMYLIGVNVVQPVGDRGRGSGGVRLDGGSEGFVIGVEVDGVAKGKKVAPVLECEVYSMQLNVTHCIRFRRMPKVREE